MAKKIVWVMAVVLIASGTLYWLYGVKVEATVDRSSFARYCPPDYPIAVRVRNNTFHRLASVELKLEGWRNGRSSDILSNNSYMFDKVLPPGARGYECFSDKAFYVEPSVEPAPNAGGYVKDAMGGEMKAYEKMEQLALNVELVIISERATFR